MLLYVYIYLYVCLCLLVCMAFIYFKMPVPAWVVVLLCPRLYSWVILRNQLTSSRDVHVNGSMYHTLHSSGVGGSAHTQIRNVCAQGVSSTKFVFFRQNSLSSLCHDCCVVMFFWNMSIVCAEFSVKPQKDQTSAGENYKCAFSLLKLLLLLLLQQISESETLCSIKSSKSYLGQQLHGRKHTTSTVVRRKHMSDWEWFLFFYVLFQVLGHRLISILSRVLS